MKPNPVYIILLIFFLILHDSVPAQTQNLLYNFKHLTIQNGLAQNIVYHFLHDSRGYMWAGTRNGLSLYDGSRTINFLHNTPNKKTIANNFITRLVEDPLSQVWVGTDVGLSVYNRQDNSFSNYTVVKDRGAFCVPLGFANTHELWLIETETKTIKIFDTKTKKADSILSTPAVDGTMWFDSLSQTRHIWTYLSTGTIHYTFRNKKLLSTQNFFGSEPGNLKEPTLQIVHALPQNNSTVWLSTTSGLVQLNPLSGKYTIHNTWGNQLVKEFRYAALSPAGMLWAATGNNGVYTFNPVTKKFIDNFRNDPLDPLSIGSNNIVSIYFDKVGNIWCGSYGQGISYTSVDKNYFQKSLPGKEFENWNGNNNVRWIGMDYSDKLWCIMNDDAGLWVLNEKKQLIEHREPLLETGKKFAGRFYKLLFYDARTAWAIGKEGIFKYDVTTNRLRKMQYSFFSHDLFGSNWVQDIIRLTDGSFLFATFAGLYRVTNKNTSHTIEPFSELNKSAFTSFAKLHQDEKGIIYIKDMGSKLYVLDPTAKNQKNLVTHSFNFLPQVNQFYTDTLTNSILLATSAGLYNLTRNNFQLQKTEFTSPPPFPGISGLIKTSGKLWLFGEKGLFCYNNNTGGARTFTTEDGLPSNEFNISAMLFSKNECIAGTVNGLVSFYPHQLQDKIYPPIVQLTNIYVNDSSTGFVSNPQETNGLHLAHDQNTFSLEFAPISFHNAAECNFEYKLEGYDADWIRSGNARYTRYSKIPPGNYVFQLRAIDVNGIISPHTKRLNIEIAKAFWQTTLFTSAMLALILTAIWFGIKWYLHFKIRKHKRQFEKQQAVEKERTRIASDMHDDLGAGLSTLKFLSEKVKRNSFSEVTKNDADKIVANSNELVQKMNEIIWAMNEKNDTLEDLLFYTRSYAVEYCEENNLQCETDIPETIPDIFVNGEMRRNVFLTVKESLHNVVKHAAAKKVGLRFLVDKHLSVSIEDNGQGFTKGQNHSGNGLKNMQQRIEAIGGSFEVLQAKGTVIIMTVPLPYS